MSDGALGVFIWCGAHSIELVTTHTLEETQFKLINDFRTDVNNIVKFIKRSPKVGEFVRSLAKQNGETLRAFTSLKKFLGHSLLQLLNFIFNREWIVKG